MKKVITYGTFDLLHYGHIRLLERAKLLGDYLIVGVTSEDFDKTRGKINVSQSLMERVEAIKKTGLADKIIIEEYEGQKIDDIRKYGVDVFAIGSDWDGKFDYLNKYCEVVYLDRTQGVSSTEIREQKCLKIGLVGDNPILYKYYNECKYVNGLMVSSIYSKNKKQNFKELYVDNYEELLSKVDAVYLISHPTKHYEDIKFFLNNSKHVLCESPIALTEKECRELFALAKSKKLVLMDAIKTAYSTAYNRLSLIIKSGDIGDVISVDSVCTSLSKYDLNNIDNFESEWNSISAWGPTALLPIFDLLGTNFTNSRIITKSSALNKNFDLFSKGDFLYPDATASFKVGRGVKSEGELIITGTKGYIVVPAPWWKTDYFEVRYENQSNNKRFFYQLEGEGIRYQLLAYRNAIENENIISSVSEETSIYIAKIMEQYYNKIETFEI